MSGKVICVAMSTEVLIGWHNLNEIKCICAIGKFNTLIAPPVNIVITREEWENQGGE